MTLLNLGLGNFVLLLVGLGLVNTIAVVVYNLWLHPLCRFPGPLLMRATRLTHSYKNVTGTLPFDMLELHQQYGDVVRIAPDELAFAHPTAWQEIQGHKTKGQPELDKNPKFYRPVEGAPADIVTSGREEHGKLRRTLAHGFSEKGLRDQQPLITRYIDLFIRRLKERAGRQGGDDDDDGIDGEERGERLDIGAWFNFATFDIIGDLAFGEPFGCLETSSYHPWVSMIFQQARAGSFLQALAHYPPLLPLLFKMMPKSIFEKREATVDLTKKMLTRRMEQGVERPDLIEGLLAKQQELQLTFDNLVANSSTLIIGGSETTATLLAGTTYFLLTNPAVLKRATDEVRAAFQSEDQIDFASVNSELPYLVACLNEGLRCYPPVPMGLPRVVPKGGVEIGGRFVAEGTTVAVHHWALYHNEKLFKDPFGFHPERFLGAPDFASDCREAFQPFHVGPRNCIGRNLAYVEMRTILARLLWNFDLRLAEDSRRWVQQKVYNLWDKGPLNVYVTERRS